MQSRYYLWYLCILKSALGFFSLVALDMNIKIPEHRINPNSIFTEQFMNRFHKVNELYDETLNDVHHLFYTTDISLNESFRFRNEIKQDDKLAFIDAMDKEITDHENGGHWSIVHRDNLPNKARPIKKSGR